MVFNSYVFWVFFIVVFALYRVLPHRGQNILLLIASYVFYGFWDWRFLFLMAGTTVVDYFIGIKIDDSTEPRRRKAWMIASVAMNLTLLGFFKYFNFFIDNAHSLLASIGLETHPWTLNVLLPVGISFYTFHEISYIVDVYRGHIRAARHFSDFALFISFFPQLVAGPIGRASFQLPQMQNPRIHKEGDFAEGLYLVLSGLFKKVVVADNMAVIANAIFFSDPRTLTGPECLVGVYAFAFQIYGDFSGYSSMAQGIAKWLGFSLIDNFKMPYLAITPSDFWSRWHISLSTFLRDYLYIPLGGNRGGTWKTYRNLMVTMLLGGLWHGAAWTFVAWGFFHGLILCLYRPFEPKPGETRSLSLPVRIGMMAVMFHLVCVSWLLFRAESLAQAGQMALQMLTDWTWTSYATTHLSLIAFYVVPLFLIEAWINVKDDLLAPVRADWVKRSVAYYYIALMLIFFPAEVSHAFIYFQF